MEVLLEENPILEDNPDIVAVRGHTRRTRSGKRVRVRPYIRSARNPEIEGLDFFDNPIFVGPYSYYKPSIDKIVEVRGHMKRLPGERNPMRFAVQDWMQGVDLEDAAGAFAGLAAASMVPSQVVRGEDLTLGQKWGKIAVALLVTLGGGFIAQNFFSNKVAKAVVTGGLAGTLATTISTFTGVKVEASGPRVPKEPGRLQLRFYFVHVTHFKLDPGYKKGKSRRETKRHSDP
jgi:hypothetical protein